MTWAPSRTSSRTISDRSKAFGASRAVGDVDRDGERGLQCKPTLAFGDCIITCTCILNLTSRCLSGDFGYKAIQSILLNGPTVIIPTRARLMTLIHPLPFAKGLAVEYLQTRHQYMPRLSHPITLYIAPSSSSKKTISSLAFHLHEMLRNSFIQPTL